GDAKVRGPRAHGGAQHAAEGPRGAGQQQPFVAGYHVIRQLAWVRGRNLAERWVGEFTGEIRQGKLRPGDRLPTEAEVVRRYGVSRTVVREALSQLQAAGLVETRHGVGTFVSHARRESGLRADAAQIATVVDLL